MRRHIPSVNVARPDDESIVCISQCILRSCTRSLILVRSRVYLRDLHRLKSSSDAWKQVDRKEPTLRSLSLSRSRAMSNIVNIAIIDINNTRNILRQANGKRRHGTSSSSARRRSQEVSCRWASLQATRCRSWVARVVVGARSMAVSISLVVSVSESFPSRVSSSWRINSSTRTHELYLSRYQSINQSIDQSSESY